MRENEVPQDEGLLGDLRELRYALDENGRYVLVESAGWEPVRVANAQAWDRIRAEVENVLEKVRAGALSPLAYHMARTQMDPGLVAGYAGLFAWQVRRHMKPAPFGRLSPERIRRYAAIFRITEQELRTVPDRADASRGAPGSGP